MVNFRLRRAGPLLQAILAGTLGLVVGGTALVWARSEITSLRYRLSELLSHHGELREEVEKLRIEAAVLTTPEQVEKRARALGLRYPKPGQVLYLDRSDVAAAPSDARSSREAADFDGPAPLEKP